MVKGEMIMETQTFKIQCHDCGGTNIGWMQGKDHLIMVCVTCENKKPEQQVTIKIGKVFFDDHVKRGCIIGAYHLQNMPKHYVVTLSQNDFADLIDDAYHYAQHSDYDFGLKASARSIIQAMRKQFTYEEVSNIFSSSTYETLKYIGKW